VPDSIAELCIGHTQRGIIAVYNLHRYTDEKREAMLKWEQRLLSVVAPPPGGNVVQIKPRRAVL
jgi:hypothetical protein